MVTCEQPLKLNEGVVEEDATCVSATLEVSCEQHKFQLLSVSWLIQFINVQYCHKFSPIFSEWLPNIYLRELISEPQYTKYPRIPWMSLGVPSDGGSLASWNTKYPRNPSLFTQPFDSLRQCVVSNRYF